MRWFRRHASTLSTLTLLVFYDASLRSGVAQAQSGDGGEPHEMVTGLPPSTPVDGSYDGAALDQLSDHLGATDAMGADQGAAPDGAAEQAVDRAISALPKGGGAISPQATALPSGAATQLGMGESFTTQLSTGGAAYSVPFALPAARGGVQPKLGLSYNSAGGFGLAGVGWSAGGSAISRQTDRGIPKYDDRDTWHPEQDRFTFGGMELVPICDVVGASCSGALVGEVMPVWADGWQYFRSRVEGGFLRFFWSPDHRTWRVQAKDGTNMEFGVALDDTGYTGALDSNPERPDEIFRWFLVRQYDAQGGANDANGPTPVNTIVYRYMQDGGSLYLSDLYDTSPKDDPTTTDLSLYAHHTRLSYEARPDPAVSYRSGWRVESALRLSRVDVTSKVFAGGVYQPRELVRRYHLDYDPAAHRSLLTAVALEGRCAAPVQEAFDESLPWTDCPRLNPVTFEYQRVSGTEPLLDNQGYEYEPFDTQVRALSDSPPHSLDEALTALMDANADGLPDVVVTAPGLYDGGFGFYPGGLGSDGNVGFGDLSVMRVQPTGDVPDAGVLQLSSPNVIPMDMDADGIIDLVHMPSTAAYSVFRPEGNTWVGREVVTPDRQDVKIDFRSNAKDTAVMDVNGDGLVDIVYSSATEYQTYLSLGRYPGGDGQFGHATWTSASTAELSTDPITACAPWSAQPVRFSDPDTRVADMNGDGMADIVRVRSGQILYWPGRGNGFWGTGDRDDCLAGGFAEARHITMDAAPHFGEADPGTLLLNDVNGDGLSDMVEVRNDGVDIYLNDNGTAWTERQILEDTPFRPTDSNYVRLTDIDGSGTPDILWGRAYEYKYIDLNGGVVPYLLTKVSNGIGKTMELQYDSSTNQMLGAEVAGDPWRSVAPTSTPVLVRSTVRDNLGVLGRAETVLSTEYSYRDPVYEGRQREFRGFREAIVTTPGDDNSPTVYGRSVFLLGECGEDFVGTPADACSPGERWRDNWREPLKGLPVVNETFDAAGTYMATQHTTYELRQLYRGLDGRRVVMLNGSAKDGFAYDTAAFDGASYEEDVPEVVVDLEDDDPEQQISHTEYRRLTVRATAGTAHVLSQTTVDDFGNTLAAIKAGCIEGCPEGPDEIITTVSNFSLAPGDDSGWLWRESTTHVESDQDQVLRNEMRHVFDARGQLLESYGSLSGSLALDRFHESAATIAPDPPDQTGGIGETVEMRLLTNTYDEFGHVVFRRGPVSSCGGGSVDSDYAQLAVAGTSYAGALDGQTGCGENAYTHTVTYDRGLGRVLTSTSPTGQPSAFEYDGFGRVTSITHADPDSPGSLAAYPTTMVEYLLPSDPSVTPYTRTHVWSQDGQSLNDGQYVEAWRFGDGLGRTIAALAPADPGHGDAGNWIVTGDVLRNRKGMTQCIFEPWFYTGSAAQYDLGAAAQTDYRCQEFDAFGRGTYSYRFDGNPDGRVVYHALATDVYDANDLVDGTYVTNISDGHNRGRRRIERIVAGGALEQREVLNEYLPTGEITKVTQHRAGSTDIVRWMKYDSFGRMVLNVEPNTSAGFDPDPSTDPSTIKAWRYAYNDAGDMVGTSDARGCGANYHYDTGGRLLAVDYSPCEDHHAAYTAPNLSTGDGTEAFYLYDDADPDTGAIVDDGGNSFDIDTAQLWGRLSSVSSLGAKAVLRYDGLGRSTGAATQVQKPGQPTAALATRYAPRWYVKEQALDSLGRVTRASTGATLSELLGADGKSELTFSYSRRGLNYAIGGSYGTLMAGVVVDAEGKTDTVTMGDAAGTQRGYAYNANRAISQVLSYRGNATAWSTPPAGYTSPDGTTGGAQDPTAQLLLEQYDYTYDYEQGGAGVGNIVRIDDSRIADDWPDSAKPVSRSYTYDDLYRLASTSYEYEGGSDIWQSPYAEENADSTRVQPSPHVSFDTRVTEQTYQYDWLGNMSHTGDDQDGFWDRSTGDRVHGTATAGPHQLLSASSRVSAPGSREGDLDVAYDDAGNMTDLVVRRDGPCLPAGASCWQRFHYQWDELGQLGRARRWDLTGADRTTYGSVAAALPPSNPAADMRYWYDQAGDRVLKTAVDDSLQEKHTVYAMTGLELRNVDWDGSDYVMAADKTSLRVPAGPATARILYATEDLPTLTSSHQHVFLELADHLGSNTLIIDHETGELVEFATYESYGTRESDYRPGRWEGFREQYGFGGKEEDIEVGLAYFGARYYSPYLGVWLSPDPVTIHDLGSDMNPYSYVGGRPVMSVDPDGRFVVLAAWVSAAITGAVVSGAINLGMQLVSNGFNFGKVNWGMQGVGGSMITGAVAGAVSGGLGGVATGFWSGMAVGATASAAGYGAGVAIGAQDGSFGGFTASVVGGGLSGGIGGAGGASSASTAVGGAYGYVAGGLQTGNWSLESLGMSLGSSYASSVASDAMSGVPDRVANLIDSALSSMGRGARGGGGAAHRSGGGAPSSRGPSTPAAEVQGETAGAGQPFGSLHPKDHRYASDRRTYTDENAHARSQCDGCHAGNVYAEGFAVGASVRAMVIHGGGQAAAGMIWSTDHNENGGANYFFANAEGSGTWGMGLEASVGAFFSVFSGTSQEFLTSTTVGESVWFLPVNVNLHYNESGDIIGVTFSPKVTSTTVGMSVNAPMNMAPVHSGEVHYPGHEK